MSSPQHRLAAGLWLILASLVVARTLAADTCSRVVLINMSGLGNVYLQNYTEHLDTLPRFIRDGVLFNSSRAQMPGINTTNIVSILSGQEPGATGVYSESWGPDWTFVDQIIGPYAPPAEGYGQIPSPVWEHIRTQAPTAKTAAIYGFEFIKYFAQLGQLNYDFYTYDVDTMGRQLALDIIQINMTDFMFIHLSDIAKAGLATYWGSPKYYMHLGKYDNFLAQLELTLKRNGYDQDTLIILTADHGRSPSEYNLATLSVPTLFYGPCLGLHEKQKAELHGTYISALNIAPTVLYTLGLKPGPLMNGRVLTELFNR
jgi:hypothetical protein